MMWTCLLLVQVDAVVAGETTHAFCAVRPPGHHAGPSGVVTCPNDSHGSHGFCLINNLAVGAAYARCVHRKAGITRVAMVDFDVHHGNGTQVKLQQYTRTTTLL
jgi:acetoin utilization deacetylase AcuC-like enzyme